MPTKKGFPGSVSKSMDSAESSGREGSGDSIGVGSTKRRAVGRGDGRRVRKKAKTSAKGSGDEVGMGSEVERCV